MPDRGRGPGASAARASRSSWCPSSPRRPRRRCAPARSTWRSCACRSTGPGCTSSSSTARSRSSWCRATTSPASTTRWRSPTWRTSSSCSARRTGSSPTSEQLAFPPMSAKEAVEVAAAGTGVVVLPMSVARLHHRKDVRQVRVTDLPETEVALAWLVERDDERDPGVRRRRARSDRAQLALSAGGSATRTTRAAGPRGSRPRSARRRTARSCSSSRVAAPAYVQAERTPGADLVEQVLHPGPGRVEVHARRRDALLVEPLAGPVERRLPRRPARHRPRRRHPERALERAPVGVVEQVAGRLVGAGEPGADHHRRRARGQRQGDVARMPYAAVGPDVAPRARGPRRRTRARRRAAGGRPRSSSAWCTWRPGRRRPSRCRRRRRSAPRCPRGTRRCPPPPAPAGRGRGRRAGRRASGPGARGRCR